MGTGCYVKLPRDITTKKAVINMQLTDNTCFAWSARSVSSWTCGQHVDRTISYPYYIDAESPGYTVSNYTKRHYQIWTTQQSVSECIYHRRTEDPKYSCDGSPTKRRNTSICCACKILEKMWPFHLDQKSIPSSKLATEQTQTRNIFVIGKQ